LTSGYFTTLAALARVRRRIVHLHSVGDGRANTIARRALRAGARAAVAVTATDIVAVSSAVRDEQLGRSRWLRRRTTIVYEQIDGARFPPADPALHGVELLFVGRLDEGKNPERALEILAALRARGRLGSARIRFAGRPSGGSTDHQAARLRQLEVQAERLGVANAVEFLGDRADVPRLMASSSALLATTITEGLPGVVIESAAAGIPAIVSSISANEEVARWLPSVVPVPLDASDDAWCDVIEDVLAQRASGFAPEKVRAGFDRSPFALRSDQPELDALWAPPAGTTRSRYQPG
jgi:glycosyltransferase involved in cell wall biosynthesis